MNRTLQAEDRISHYRVVGPLASGGMGEVYLAHDQTLERNVALKVLPSQLVRNEERVRRFVREAKSASSLSHPNIVTIYEIGHEPVQTGGDDGPVSDPIHFISMELVSGETLRNEIHSRKTDLKSLLSYLVQAAEGISRAHDGGIVHRDLKPSNIMVSRDGYAKVLDFGLAKLLEGQGASEDLTAGATVSLRTDEGMALGTVGYMSPEQIRGNHVDHRSDIFSFGCILYECVTRQRAFSANTDVETLHKILHDEPTAVEELNADAPRALQRLIKRCLARNPDRRLQSMKDLAIELQEIVDEYETLVPSSGSPAASSSGIHATVGGRRIPPIVLSAVAVAGTVGLVLGIRALLEPGPKPTAVAPPPSPRVVGIVTDVAHCALSPEGKYVAYVAGPTGSQGLWVRQLATGSNVELSAPVHTSLRHVSFSPDGAYVWYVEPMPENPSYWSAYQVPSLGGVPQQRMVDVDSRLSFSPDGRRACFRRGGVGVRSDSTNLVIVDLDTGDETILVTAASFTFGSPAWSPSGERIAAIQAGSDGPDTLVVIDAATGSYEQLGEVWASASSCAWLPEDRGVIVSASQRDVGEGGDQIWCVSRPDGGVRRITRDDGAYQDVTVAADGSAVAALKQTWSPSLWWSPLTGRPAPRRLTPASARSGSWFFSFVVLDDASVVVGKEYQLSLLQPNDTPAVPLTRSPDMRSFNSRSVPGSRAILFERSAHGEDVHHIWRLDLDGGRPTQLTSGPGEHLWFASASAFVYRSGGEQYVGYLDGREPRTMPGMPRGISPDGKWVLALQSHDLEGPRSFAVLSLETLEERLTFPVPGDVSFAEWTAGSDAVTYIRRAAGTQEIVRQPLDGGEPTSLLEITRGRVMEHEWSPDGEALALEVLEDEVENLWIFPAADGELRPITDFRTGEIYQWSWSPDGQGVYFQQGNSERNAVLVRDFE